jgi:sulfopyruvate decarboxylase TPP-binding subunit
MKAITAGVILKYAKHETPNTKQTKEVFAIGLCSGCNVTEKKTVILQRRDTTQWCILFSSLNICFVTYHLIVTRLI